MPATGDESDMMGKRTADGQYSRNVDYSDP
jgi:hypothetical protein